MPEPSNRSSKPRDVENTSPQDTVPNTPAAASTEASIVEAYLEDELQPSEARRFESRLAKEPQLAAELALARQIRDELRALPFEGCPAPVMERVEAHIRAASAEGKGVASHGPTRLGGWRRLFASTLRPAMPSLAMVPTLAALALAALIAFRLAEAPAPGPAPGPGSSTAPRNAPTSSDPVSQEPAPRPEISGQEIGNQAIRGSVDRPMTGYLGEASGRGLSEVGPELSAAEIEKAEREVKLALAYLGRFGRTATQSVRDVALELPKTSALAAGDGKTP